MKQLYVMADASPEDKAAACEEAAKHILAYVAEKNLESKLLEALVYSCVSTVAIESYTRDACSDQARNQIYREAVDEMAQILGLEMSHIVYQPGQVN